MRDCIYILLFAGWIQISAASAIDPQMPWPLRYGISERCRNCLCQLLLAAQNTNSTALTVGKLRTFRLRRLNVPTTPPRLIKNFARDEKTSPSDLEALASHVRGIEVWTESHFQERSGEAKLTTAVYQGRAQIERYYRQLETQSELITRANATDPGHVLRMISRIASANGGGALLVFSTGLDLALKLHHLRGLPIPWWGTTLLLGALDPLAAHRFRFNQDRERRAFDARATAYLEANPEDQKSAWIFSSQIYRAQWRTMDAAYSRDASKATAAVREQSYVDNFGVGLRALAHARNLWQAKREGVRLANHPLQDGFVIVDHLLQFDPETEAPELIVAVRTIARNPRLAAPVSDHLREPRWRLNVGGRLAPRRIFSSWP